MTTVLPTRTVDHFNVPQPVENDKIYPAYLIMSACMVLLCFPTGES